MILAVRVRRHVLALGSCGFALLAAQGSFGRDTPAAQTPALVNAASAGDLAQVRALLRGGADVNAADAQKRTALSHAAAAGHVTVVRALIAAKADVNAADPSGLTALIAATRAGKLEAARALLDASADPDRLHRAYGTALDVAERQGNQTLAALLRARGARGSGKSVGDTVCVRVWRGEGYCGVVTGIEGSTWVLRVERLVGCDRGCAADACSMGRPVGGDGASAVRPGDEVRVEGACLTHTGVSLDPR